MDRSQCKAWCGHDADEPVYRKDPEAFIGDSAPGRMRGTAWGLPDAKTDVGPRWCSVRCFDRRSPPKGQEVSMRGQPKVWCDANEEACGACAELKNPPMSTPAAPEPRVGDTWEYSTGTNLKGSRVKLLSRHECGHGWVTSSPWKDAPAGTSCWEDDSLFRDGRMRFLSRAADDEPAPKNEINAVKNPAPAVGQRRQWEGGPYTIVGQIDHLFTIKFDSDGETDSMASFAVEALADDRYLGQADLCSGCSEWLRPGEVHVICPKDRRSRKPTPVAGTPVPTVFVPGRGYVSMAPRKPDSETTVASFDLSKAEREMRERASRALRKQIKGAGEKLRKIGSEVAEMGPSAVAKAPGARDWMMGLRDDWDNLPDA